MSIQLQYLLAKIIPTNRGRIMRLQSKKILLNVHGGVLQDAVVSVTLMAIMRKEAMSAEDLDNYETDAELALYKEYRDVIKLFTYVVETERRFYLANKVDFNVRSAGQDVYFDVQLTDAWVWTFTALRGL